MQIERKGSGPWAEVAVDGVTVTLALDGETLAYDCAALQQRSQVAIDVVRNLSGQLVQTAADGGEYVANLIIPPARYADVDLPAPAIEEEIPEGVDPACIQMRPLVETVQVPLAPEDMETVRLILWTVTEKTHQEGF